MEQIDYVRRTMKALTEARDEAIDRVCKAEYDVAVAYTQYVKAAERTAAAASILVTLSGSPRHDDVKAAIIEIDGADVNGAYHIYKIAYAAVRDTQRVAAIISEERDTFRMAHYELVMSQAEALRSAALYHDDTAEADRVVLIVRRAYTAALSEAYAAAAMLSMITYQYMTDAAE